MANICSSEWKYSFETVVLNRFQIGATGAACAQLCTWAYSILFLMFYIVSCTVQYCILFTKFHRGTAPVHPFSFIWDMRNGPLKLCTTKFGRRKMVEKNKPEWKAAEWYTDKNLFFFSFLQRDCPHWILKWYFKEIFFEAKNEKSLKWSQIYLCEWTWQPHN